MNPLEVMGFFDPTGTVLTRWLLSPHEAVVAAAEEQHFPLPPQIGTKPTQGKHLLLLDPMVKCGPFCISNIS